MSTATVLSSIPSLASTLRVAASEAAAGRPACLWCGSQDVSARTADDWPHELTLACHACGAETGYDRRLARRKGG